MANNLTYSELNDHVNEMSRGCNNSFYTMFMPGIVAVIVFAGLAAQVFIG